jgi:hypothetical protein
MRKAGRLMPGAMLLAAWAALAAPARAALDDFYYTYDEIHAELTALAAQYPDWVRLDSIGHAQESMTPIWSVKISDNVQVEEDEPAFWVGGHVHAEEILGINISMNFMRRLVELGSQGHPNWAPLLESLEIHMVPSYNPDGLGIVMSEEDITYRKNLRSMAPDGHCHIHPGIGADSCGVDLNRNYDVWWNHSDGLWSQDSDVEQYDYYRGPGPLSEAENQAIAALTERERFVAGVAYHSARTSTNHEIVIFPWAWENSYTNPAPDFAMFTATASGMASVIDGINYHPYRHVAGSGRVGNHHNWIYATYGGLGFTIEVGTQGSAGMQPQNQQTIDFIVNENIDGLNWLCRRIIGYDVAAPGLVAHVRDAQTQQPLAARLRIVEVMSPDCAPWYRTDPLHGAYYRLLAPQAYTVNVRKHGYVGQDTPVVVGSSLPTQRDWNLAPLPRHAVSLSFQAHESGSPLLAERLELRDLGADTLLVWTQPGEFAANLPQGAYELTAWIPGRIPVHRNMVLTGPLTLTLDAVIQGNDGPGMFTRAFPDLAEFSQLGSNCGWTTAWGDSLGWHFQDSPGRWSAADMDCRLATTQSWLLDAPVRTQAPGALEFVEFHELEGGQDSAFVEFSGNGGLSWTVMRAWSGPGRTITRHSVPIGPEWAGTSFQFAFRVKTNARLEDAGFHVKDIRLSWNGNVLELEPAARPGEFHLSASPNPFNPRTTLRMVVPAGVGNATATVRLFDLAGRQVRPPLSHSGLGAGVRDMPLEAAGLPSGLYFAQVTVEAGGRQLWQGVQRLTLLK